MSSSRHQATLGTLSLSEANSKIIDHAIELGIAEFDTADCYGAGESETALGAALAAYAREDIVISTKCGVRFSPERTVTTDGSRDYLIRGCEASLARLKTDYIDVFYLHRVGQNASIEESMYAMRELVTQEKIRGIGLSEVTADQIRRANAIHPIKAVQIEFSPWARQDEKNGVLATCHELGITVTGYSPLGRAFFSNTDHDFFQSLTEADYRKRLPRYNGDFLKNNLEQRAKLECYANNKAITLAQLSLAWINSKGVVPVFGTNSIEHLDENVAALSLNFAETDLIELDALINTLQFEGDRYPSREVSGIFPEQTSVSDSGLFSSRMSDDKDTTALEKRMNSPRFM